MRERREHTGERWEQKKEERWEQRSCVSPLVDICRWTETIWHAKRFGCTSTMPYTWKLSKIVTHKLWIIKLAIFSCSMTSKNGLCFCWSNRHVWAFSFGAHCTLQSSEGAAAVVCTASLCASPVILSWQHIMHVIESSHWARYYIKFLKNGTPVKRKTACPQKN